MPGGSRCVGPVSAGAAVAQAAAAGGHRRWVSRYRGGECQGSPRWPDPPIAPAAATLDQPDQPPGRRRSSSPTTSRLDARAQPARLPDQGTRPVGSTCIGSAAQDPAAAASGGRISGVVAGGVRRQRRPPLQVLVHRRSQAAVPPDAEHPVRHAACRLLQPARRVPTRPIRPWGRHHQPDSGTWVFPGWTEVRVPTAHPEGPRHAAPPR